MTYEEEPDVFSHLDLFHNCTNISTDASCLCFDCNVYRCLLCCPPQSCCYYDGDHLCNRTSEWNTVRVIQISILILFVLGVISMIIIYFRICRRATRVEYMSHIVIRRRQNERGSMRDELNDDSIRATTGLRGGAETLPDRPPPYSEIGSAPPLYTSPFNRVSMLEAPPVYPEGGKSSEEVSPPNTTTPNTHHI
ncbi:hypothetical protein KM043_006217 [Ampulex compressa]|nr:hypothetical protein KM043_006217 [Ampulex compressa]